MLNVLYLPIGSQPGTENAFRSVGTNLRVYDFFSESQSKSKDQVCAAFLHHVGEHKPDLVHMQLQMTDTIGPEVIDRARAIAPNAIFTNWTGDIRTKPAKGFVKMSHHVDYSLLSHIGQIKDYQDAGTKNAIYWQTGYNPDVYFPQNKTDFKYDVVFAGNAYPRSQFPDAQLRVNVAKKLLDRFGTRAGIFGSGYHTSWKVKSADITTMNSIYNNSRTVLSISNFNDVSHYFSDRLLMCLASGRPTIVYRFPGYKSYFANSSDVLIAENPDHVCELVQHCINNPDFANKVGKNGYRRVYNEHSFESRVMELLTILQLTDRL